MRPIRFPMVLLVLLSGACNPAPAPELSTAQRDSLDLEVRAVIADITEAMNSHDPERFLSFFRDSGEFVYVGCTDPMFGFRDFAIRVTPYYRNSTEVTFQQEILRVQIVDPTTAVVTLQASSPETPTVFSTEVLVKEESGRWLIVHEHQSWAGCPEPRPFHPTGMPGEFETLEDTVGTF